MINYQLKLIFFTHPAMHSNMSIFLDVDCKTSTLYSANYLQNMLFSAAPRVCKLDFMKPSVFTS